MSLLLSLQYCHRYHYYCVIIHDDDDDMATMMMMMMMMMLMMMMLMLIFVLLLYVHSYADIHDANNSLQDIAMATWHPPIGLQTLQAIVTSKAVHLVLNDIHPRNLHIDTKNDGFLRKCISGFKDGYSFWVSSR